MLLNNKSNKKNRSRLFKAAIILLAVVVLIVVGVNLLSGALEKRIREAKLGPYKASYGQINIRLLAGNLMLKNVELNDTTGAVHILAPEISFKGFHFFPFIFQKKIVLNSISLTNPTIVFHLIKSKTDSTEEKQDKSQISRSINIHQIKIDNAKLLVDSLTPSGHDSTFNTQFGVQVWDVSTDQLSKSYSYQNISFDRLKIYLKNGEYNLPDRLNSIRYSYFEYDSDHKGLSIDTISLHSLYQKYEIGKITGKETAWFNMIFTGFNMKNIRLATLLNDTALISDEIRIKNFTADVFKDKRLPFIKNKEVKLPMDMLNSLPFAFHTDSVILENADIEYSQRVDDSNKAGAVSFNKLSAKIENLSNIDSLIRGATTLKASAKVMNKATLSAVFVMPNKKYPGKTHATGQMGPMEIASFNPMLRPSAAVIAKKGKIVNLSFDFNYDNDRSDGVLNFEYTELKIEFFDPSDFSTKKVKSFLVNKMVLHDENLKGDKNYREGKIAFERDKKRAVFNFWWKSILSGLKSIAIF